MASMPKRLLRFEFYSVHGHTDTGAVDYLRLLKILAGLKDYHFESNGYHVAVGNATLTGEQLFLTIYTGSSETSVLFFDLNVKKELVESSQPGRFQARKTHALIDGGKRILLLETKKGALNSLRLATLLEEYARKTSSEFGTLDLSFNPVADKGFIEQINDFYRIQTATVTIKRPNVDWTDRHTQLTEVAKESNARTLDVAAHASRGKSLSKDNGLVEFIKSSASSAKSMFQKIKIVGSFDGDSGLISLNLTKHIRRADFSMQTDATNNLPSETELRAKLASYLTDDPSLEKGSD
jgi:hypothetical protein